MAETKEPPLSGPASGSRSNSAAVQASTGTVKSTSASSSQSPTSSTPRAGPPRQKYRMPLPLRTFPLPTFYPSNPVSLVHLAVAWVRQVLLPPADEPATVHTGVWSSATRSVHVTDPKSMNDLWSQGFYGKGSLSRSEPNWLNREKARQAAALVDAASSSSVAATSEQRTNKRREERADTKWERGRTELEAIEQRRREEEAAEAEAAAAAEAKAKEAAAKEKDSLNGHANVVSSFPSPPPSPTPIIFKAPVGPLELLALPNSEADLTALKIAAAVTAAAVVAVESTHLNGSASKIETDPKSHVNGSALQQNSNGTVHSKETTEKTTADMNGSAEPAVAASPSVSSSATRPIEPLKRQKSVRFSPTVESTTFLHSDPPSPNHGARSPQTIPTPTTTTPEIVNKEHLQLAPEEAFFLSYGIGALQVMDERGRALSTKELLALCRASRVATTSSSSSSTLFSSTSSSPSPPSSAAPWMDDFLLHYSVYHHFRSLGWVPRHGIKFGVDWMLYGKGPALDHAEFGVMVIPSFERWPEATKATNNGRRLSWHWLHSVNRVLSTVFKSLVLVYVDVPPPPEGDVDVDVDDISALLSQYKIREVMVRRWSSNRNRD